MVEPSKEELSNAILLVLKENINLTAKEVKTKLIDEHADWKIPDRRVKKFVKRHTKIDNPAGLSDDDTNTSEFSAGTKKESFIKRWLTPSKKSLVSEQAPKKEDEGVEVVLVTEPEPELEVVAKNLSEIYSEDNAEKNDDCECNACVIS